MQFVRARVFVHKLQYCQDQTGRQTGEPVASCKHILDGQVLQV